MNTFKIGDKIICIGSNYIYNKYNNMYELNEYAPLKYSLTQYKEYTVVNNPKSWYDTVGILNNNGEFTIPNWDQFVSIKEYRKLKLEKINKKCLI